MKMRKVFVWAIFAALAVTSVSCLKQEAEIFDKPASARLEEYLENVRSLLSSSENGWLLEYYPGTSYAGTVFELKFTDQEVTARHELKLGTKATSGYALKTDAGAVLSFNSYNEVLHQYATPSARLYQAKGGDFEFYITGVEEDLITLRGKRSQNVCYLHRLSEPGLEYLKKVNAMEAGLSVAALATTISGGMVEAFLDAGTRLFTIGRKGATADEQVNVRYVMTDKGIKFARTFTFQGVTFDELVFNSEKEELSGSDIVFTKTIPEGWVSYEGYLGKYTLSYGSGRGTFPVELAKENEGSSFALKGLFPGHEDAYVSIAYSGGRGRLTMLRQVVGSWGSKSMLFAPWDSTEGYYTWSEGVGVIGYVEDASVNDFTIVWEDNGIWSSLGDSNYKVNAWLIVPFDGSSPTDDDTPSDWFFPTGSEQLPGDITLTKIVE